MREPEASLEETEPVETDCAKFLATSPNSEWLLNQKLIRVNDKGVVFDLFQVGFALFHKTF